MWMFAASFACCSQSQDGCGPLAAFVVADAVAVMV
jgi:uncharacterized protein (DUF779 family)